MRFLLIRLLPLAALLLSASAYLPGIPPPPPPPQPLPPFPPELEKAGSEPVDVEALRRTITSADRLVVVSLSPAGDEWPAYETTKAEDIIAFRDALRLDTERIGFRDMCDGQPAFRLYRQGKPLARLSFHHGTSFRYNPWESDVPITDPEPLLRWFDARGIDGPRKEVEKVLAEQELSRQAVERWVASMPAALKPSWQEMREAGDDGRDLDSKRLRAALAKAAPEEGEQIRALYAWFGSGAGPWSGFPSYEEVAERLLLTYSTSELLAVAEKEGLTEAELEGAARLFGGWTFGQEREEDLARLSPALRARLLAQAIKSDDEDKRGRAQDAFDRRGPE
jgi:hypothetical protein